MPPQHFSVGPVGPVAFRRLQPAMAEQVEEPAPFGNVKLKVMAYTIPMMLVARCKVESWKRGVLGQHLGM